MNRLTFQIQDGASLRAGARFSWASVRAKLFAASAPKRAIQTLPASRKYGQTRPASFPAARPSYFDAAPNGRPFVTAKSMEKSAPVFVRPQPVEASQTAYKGRMIHAVRLEDGNWTAFHYPANTDPSALRPAPDAHRFMARILAIASAEIEIDDLESA